MKLDKKKIFIGTICFATIGLSANRLIGGLSVFIVPFIFGLILPFVNWRDLGQKKMMKLTFVTFTSLVLFYLSFFAAITLGKNSLVVVSIICGLAGVGLYVTTSVFVSSLDKGLIQLGLIFVLGGISIPATLQFFTNSKYLLLSKNIWVVI